MVQMEKKDCESGIEGTKSDRTWTMAGVGGSRRRNQRCTPSFASELGGVCDAANRIRDLGRSWFGGKDEFVSKSVD